jgi:hypothetical protein
MSSIITRPCGALYLRMDKVEKSIFHVYNREGENIPDLCGQSEGREFLILGMDFNSDEEPVTFSLYTTKEDVVGVNTGELYRGEEMTRIARFDLTPDNRDATKYDDYALLFNFNSQNTISILFYDGLGRHASSLLTALRCGFLEDRVL